LRDALDEKRSLHMSHQSELIQSDIHAYLKSQEEKSLLRFITCGSVDDGKSTLIGRLLWDSKLVFEDQLAALKADSKRVGTQEGEIDYALLLDGLQAEREQGITIDVAYRFFSTDKRKFIVADTPGHEQYTRNMVTGASTAQVAVILIDARKGILTQSRRHSYLASLVGIRNVVLAINKMDLVGYSASRFESICKEYQLFANGLGFDRITAIPISALNGDNVIKPSVNTPWYSGPALLEHLENTEISDTAAEQPFRMRVQWVNRPNLNFRGFCGTIASGRIHPGDEIVVTSSGQSGRIARIVTMDGDLSEAVAGQAITLTLDDEIDISRGDLLATADALPNHSERYEAKLVWLHEEALRPGHSYLLKAGATTAPAKVETLQHKINVNTLQEEPGVTLELNEVGACVLNISRDISFDTYRDNRSSGSFILIDRMTNATVGAGMIDSALETIDRSPGATHEIDVTARAAIKGHAARILWFTGSAAGEGSQFAISVEQKLHVLGMHSHLLDDKQLRQNLNNDLTDSGEDRAEELRRLVAVAQICADAGLIVLVSSSTPLPAGQYSDSIEVVSAKQADGSLEEQADNVIRTFFC
jgi:bifunctional enzyme CysN/CysC